MSLQIEGRTIQKVLVIDDEEDSREAWGFSVEDLGLVPVPVRGPLTNIERFLIQIPRKADAILCDYHLKTTPYANFNGDDLVASCYKQELPGVLCTRFLDADIDIMRRHLRSIPALLKPSELDPDTLKRGLERCIREFRGEFDPSRKSWRTLIRIEDIEDIEPMGSISWFYVIIPGWNPAEAVRLPLDLLPSPLQRAIKPGIRLHARVNVGAESQQSLYFEDWEPD